MVKKKGSALKIRRKNWYKIFAPKFFRSQVIGESLLDSAEKLADKIVNVNLAALIGDMKKQGIVIKFKVKEIRPEGGYTEITGFRILPSTLKRFIRRSIKSINDSFECVTADNIRIRVKPVIITRTPAKGGIAGILSKTGKITLIKYIRAKRYTDIINDIISTRLQREIKEKLNKIFPMRIFEIKALIKVEGKVKEEEKAQEGEKPKEEKVEKKEEVKEEKKPEPKPAEEKSETKPEEKKETKE